MKRSVLILACLLTTALWLGGCTGTPRQAKQQVESYRRAIQSAHDRSQALDGDLNQLTDTLDQTQRRLDALPEGSAQARALSDRLARVRKTIAQVRTQKARVEDRAQTLADQLGDLEDRIDQEGLSGLGVGVTGTGLTIEQVGGLLPPPWNLLATGIGGLLALIGGTLAHKNKQRADRETAHRRAAEGKAQAVEAAVDRLAGSGALHAAANGGNGGKTRTRTKTRKRASP